MELKNLKKDYNELAKKHKLPGFEKLNEDFEIERIVIESDYLLRAVRKTMMDKVVGWLRFFEMITNSTSAPRIYHAYIKSMTPEGKKEIEKIYSELGDINLAALELEIEYSEKNEAATINKIFKEFGSLKPSLKKIIKEIQNPEQQNAKATKSYFG
jgi:hypothetical protein